MRYYFKANGKEFTQINPKDFPKGKYDWEQEDAAKKAADVVVCTEHPEMVEKILKGEVDVVTVNCSCETDLMERKEAIDFYKECVCFCEGSERDRYINILIGLESGDKTVSDEE